MVYVKQRPSYINLIRNLALKHGKMAFITGPRQVGKTTIAKHLLSQYPDGRYYNWDDVAFRRRWIKDPKSAIPQIVGQKPLVVFDEIHKAPRWKSYLKGIYDMRGEDANIVVTGSAKLDTFRRGGDSLLGRYFQFRLHPFSVGELSQSSIHPDKIKTSLSKTLSSKPGLLKTLLEHSGFPEPFLKSDTTFTNLWRRTRIERLVREDLRDLTQTHELPLIEAAASLIPERIGSPFSIQSLAEDLEISHPTGKRWIKWLSQLYYLYSVTPYSKNIARSIKKQPKLYLWDWSEILNNGPRFENIIASHLLKAIHFWMDSGIDTFELFYLRDKEKREVDFLVVRNRKPWMLVESKSKKGSPSSHLYHFSKILRPELVIQIVEQQGVHEWFDITGEARGHLVSADSFLGLLP